MKRKQIILATLIVLLSGCTLVSGFFDNRALNRLKEDTETEKVMENIQWAVERMQTEDEYAPDLLAKILPLSREKAEEIGLDQANPALYNQLIERYVALTLHGVNTTEPEDWAEKGYPYQLTNDYLRASAAYQLGRLKGDAITSQLLVMLDKLDSPAIQSVLLKSMSDRVDDYRKNPEIQAQAIRALSNIDIQKLSPDSVLASQLSHLEGELVTLSMLNRVLSKRDIYQLSDRNLTYLLDLNEGVWMHLLSHPEKINKGEVVTNARLLSSLALPAREQLDGLTPEYTVIEKQAQRLLLQYVPGLYYFSMFNHAKTSDYSFGQLLASKEYMDRYEAYATKAKGQLVAKGDEGRPFFNHHVLMNDTVYQKSVAQAKAMIFKSLYNRVETRPFDYIDFIYSYLNLNYSKDFAVYLLSKQQQKYRSSGIDQLQHYYALLLTSNKAISERGKTQLLNLVTQAQLTRTLQYSANEMQDYAARVYPTFIEKNSAALLAQLSAEHRNVARQKGVTALADYYIVALDKIALPQRKQYLNFAAAVIAQHDEVSSRKLMGAYRPIPLADAASSLANIAFNKPAKVLPTQYLYLGNYIQSRHTEVNTTMTKIYGDVFDRGVNQADSDDAALIAAQQGMLNFSSMRPALSKSVSKRLTGVEL